MVTLQGCEDCYRVDLTLKTLVAPGYGLKEDREVCPRCYRKYAGNLESQVIYTSDDGQRYTSLDIGNEVTLYRERTGYNVLKADSENGEELNERIAERLYKYAIGLAQGYGICTYLDSIDNDDVNAFCEDLGIGAPPPANTPAKFTVQISGETVELTISVNDEGNLVLGNVGGVNYEIYGDELVLSRVSGQGVGD